MRDDLLYSKNRMVFPIEKIRLKQTRNLTPEDREIISAFNNRFSTYQDQIGSAFKNIAIEENVQSERFTTILSLMEKIGILKDVGKWSIVRDLRNASSHVYEDNEDELFQILDGMIKETNYLFDAHQKMQEFALSNYIKPKPTCASRKPKRNSTPGMR